MVTYSVSLGGLETLIESIQEASSGIAAELARLDVQVSGLEAAWSGQVNGNLADKARTGFTSTWANLDGFAIVQ